MKYCGDNEVKIEGKCRKLDMKIFFPILYISYIAAVGFNPMAKMGQQKQQ
jgi:hypothetical protein